MKRYFLLFIFLVFAVGCKNDTSKKTSDENQSQQKDNLSFSRVVLKGSDFDTCKEEKCPKVDLNYLIADGNPAIATKINEHNTQHIIEIFNSSEDKPESISVENAVQNFLDDYFDFKDEFPEAPGGYEADLSQKLISKSDSIFTIETIFYIFRGGAHGYGATRYQNFDAKTGKFLTQDDLIKDIEDFKKFVEKKFRKKYKIKPDANINSPGFFFENDTFALPENIAVTANEVFLVYNRYEAASYAQGELKFVFPKKEVQQFLNY